MSLEASRLQIRQTEYVPENDLDKSARLIDVFTLCSYVSENMLDIIL